MRPDKNSILCNQKNVLNFTLDFISGISNLCIKDV